MTVHSFAHSGQENILNYKRSHNREASRIIKSWRLLLPHMTSKTSDKYIATFAQPAKTTCKSEFHPTIYLPSFLASTPPLHHGTYYTL